MTQPEIFGRYQLLTLAGSGGMAQVHLARQVGPDGYVKPCVLKRIVPNLVSDPALRRMFMEEARVSALLNHPNVVQTFDYGEVDGVPYMAMELVDGVNLAKLCRTLAEKRRWFPLQSAVDLCICLVKALEYAHRLTDLTGRPLNLVHRDVSPQNTLLSRVGAVKLADFGIARHEAREQVTLQHTAKGKPGYMAPEQAMGGPIDARADLFSVGVILAELLSARRVLPSGGAVRGVLEIEARVNELCNVRKDAPPALTRLAARLVSIDPDRRPANATETLALLVEAKKTLPASTALDEFLRTVFEAFVERHDFDAPPPPPAEESIEKTWIDQAPATGTAVVYEGWPREFLDSNREPPALALPAVEPPAPPDEIGLVPNSSTVESMQYFGAETSKEAQRRAQPIEVPQIERMFSDEPHEEPPAARSPAKKPAAPKPPRKPIPVVVWLGIAAAIVAGLVVWAIATLDSGGDAAPPVVATGTIEVRSTPPGATIWLDGRKVPQKTPASIDELPLDRPIRVEVAKVGFAVRPRLARVTIPAGSKKTTATFDLEPGRQLQVTSDPPDGVVSVNGERLSTPTPTLLQPIALGETASITVELDEHLPGFVRVEVTAETSSIVHLALAPAQRIDISSEPPGALVSVDGAPHGKTPAYEVLVPATGRFTIVVERPGFRRWRQRVRADRLADRAIVAELVAMPLLSLPLEPQERKIARRLDSEVSVLRKKQKRIAHQLERAQEKLQRVEASNTVFIGDLAEAQRRVDVLTNQGVTTEDALAEAESRLEAFRDRVLARVGED